MSENRLIANLREARRAGRKCLMPYLTAGFPDLETTVSLIGCLDSAGCPAIEIGFPFSDSIADGPVIQESFYRALDAGFTTEALFEAVASSRARWSAALVAMVSMSLVRRRSLDAFVTMAAKSGFDGLIVPDVPVEECDALSEAARLAGLCNVLMLAPTSSEARRQRIGCKSTGFVYVIAARGITGERKDVSEHLAEEIARDRVVTDLPLIVGFGISTPEHVRKVCSVADGAIVGSAIVRRISDCMAAGKSRATLVDTVGEYVDALSGGLSGGPSGGLPDRPSGHDSTT